MAVKAKKVMKPRMKRKEEYCAKLKALMEDYCKVLVVKIDNVGSNQMQQIRRGLRGDSVLLMGKNTLMKKALSDFMTVNHDCHVQKLMDLLKGNVGLVFTKGDLKEIRDEINKFKVGAPARIGLVAPIDVVIQPGNTGLEPSNTSFFQALNIPTKINKGAVEIIQHVDLIKKGDKVGSSEAALLARLNIKPFSYGLVIQKIYDSGSVYDPEVLDITEDVLAERFAIGVANISALALSISYPSLSAVPHMIVNGYKNVLSVALGSDYSFPLADQIKEYLKDPSKFVTAVIPVSAGAGVADTSTGGAVAEEAKEESEEEEEVDGGLFGDIFA